MNPVQVSVTVSSILEAKVKNICLSAGIPMERGALTPDEPLTLLDAAGRPRALQAKTTSRWPDGSAKWVLLDFTADNIGDTFMLKKGEPPLLKHPVSVTQINGALTLSNGYISFTVKPGSNGTFTHTDGSAIEIYSSVQIGYSGEITSHTVIDKVEIYSEGPVRAAVSLTGRRVYSDGVTGPFSQYVEMFEGCSHLRVEDTFIYSHFPGTHAEPQNPLYLWKLHCQSVSTGNSKLSVVNYSDPEESEGVRTDKDGIAFWAGEPFPLERYTDEDKFGEDCPGISLGLGKTMAALVGFDIPECSNMPVNGVLAHTTPDIYANSGAFADFSAKHPLRFEVIEEGMRQVLGFWCYFQDNDPIGYDNRGPWHGLLDWGDWQVRYSDPYSGKPTGWQYYEGRYGWDCGEMDTVLMLWHAFIHTGDIKYWRPAVAMSRHTMDVDTIHVDYRDYDLPDYIYDKHHYNFETAEGERLRNLSTVGQGRRHNVQHWGNGIGDTRHTFNAGTALYYLLTGNRRAYDCTLLMADMHAQRVVGFADGEYALAQECLYCAYKISGDEKYLDEFKARLAILAKLQYEDGSLPNRLDFDAGRAMQEVKERAEGEGPKGFCASLSLDYMSNTLADYYYDTGDELAASVLLKLTECAYKHNDTRVGLSYPDLSDIRCMSWAYLYTGDIKYRDRAEYLLYTMAAQPTPRSPETPEDWVALTYNVMWRQEWRIRHIGPGIRMIPYAIKAVE